MFEDFYSDLIKVAEPLSLPEGFLTEDTAKKLYIHSTELSEKGKLFNLTAITEESEVIRKHMADCLFEASVIFSLSGGEKKTLIDVGSGGGFPSLPIAISCGNVSVTALDSTAKKCTFIKETADKCGTEISVCPMRAEDFAKEARESFDFATARAVASLDILAELCLPFVKVGGYFAAMKGSNYAEETEKAKNAAKKLGAVLVECREYEIETTGVRSVVIYKKVEPTPSNYPRQYSQIKKKPL